MHVRPVTDDDIEELDRGFKVVVDERRWIALQSPLTEAALAEGLRRDHYRRNDGKLHSSVIMARLFPEADPSSSQ